MIRWTKTLHAAIAAEGEKSYPNECCGILIGTEGSDGAREISKIHRVENHFEGGEQYHRFSIDPLDYLRAEREAAKENLSVLGIYHSHPDHPAKPSEYDRNTAWQYYSYVIVSINNGRADSLRCWRLVTDGNSFEEETVEQTDERCENLTTI